MASKITLMAFLGLDTSQMKEGMSKAEKSAAKGSEKIGQSLRKGVNVLATAAAAAAAAAAVAITAFVAKSIMEFVEFEEKMNEVFTLLPDQSRAAERKMTQDAKNLAREFGILPNEVVPALYQAISAGVPKENVFDFMAVASKAAIGGVSTVETAVDGLSTAMNTYGQENLSAKDAADAMFTAVKLGKTNFELLSGSMSTVLPVAKAMGVDFDQVMAAVATLTKQGVPTAQAMTQIRAAMQALGSPTTRQSEYLQSLGVDTEKLKAALAGPNGLAVAMQMMEKAAAGDNEKLRKMVGSVEALQGILGVTARGGLIMAESMDAMGKKAGANEVAYNKMNESLKRTFEALKATVSVGLTNAGAAFSRLLVSMGPALQRLADIFADFDWGGVTQAMSNLGKSLAPTLMKLANAVGELMREVFGLFEGIGAGKGIIESMVGVIIKIVHGVKGVVQFVKQLLIAFEALPDGAKSFAKIIAGFALGPIKALFSIAGFLLKTFGDLGMAFGIAMGDIIAATTKTIGKLLQHIAPLVMVVDEAQGTALMQAAIDMENAERDLAAKRKQLEDERNQRAREAHRERMQMIKAEKDAEVKAVQQKEEAKVKDVKAEIAKKRQAMIALTGKPFWTVATVKELESVPEAIMKKAMIALTAKQIGPMKELKVGGEFIDRRTIMDATGMTPEQIAATKRHLSITEGKKLDKQIETQLDNFQAINNKAADIAEENKKTRLKNFFLMIGKAGGPSMDDHRAIRERLRGDQRAAFDARMIQLYQRGVAIHQRQLDEKTAGVFGQKLAPLPPSRKPTFGTPSPVAFTPRPVGAAQTPTVKIDANDMLKKMNTFYGTAIKDIQKSLRSIDYSLKGKFVNQ